MDWVLCYLYLFFGLEMNEFLNEKKGIKEPLGFFVSFFSIFNDCEKHELEKVFSLTIFSP